jgi:nitrile hydratase accessory protein
VTGRLGPRLPLAEGSDDPVFREPWEAQVFAMVVRLHEAGHFAWDEWTRALGAEIARAGPDDPPENYYLHWLSVLERLVADRGLVDADLLEDRRRAWDRAARATPHGQPIVLGSDRA